MDVDNMAVRGSFNRGRARDPETHGLLVKLFDLQVAHDFFLSLQWVPSAANGVADAISRPSRETVVCLMQAAFQALRDIMGPFDVDLMASDVSVQRHPFTGIAFPFFSRYDCEGTPGNEKFAQNVVLHPTLWETALAHCSRRPPPGVGGSGGSAFGRMSSSHRGTGARCAGLLVPGVASGLGTVRGGVPHGRH